MQQRKTLVASHDEAVDALNPRSDATLVEDAQKFLIASYYLVGANATELNAKGHSDFLLMRGQVPVTNYFLPQVRTQKHELNAVAAEEALVKRGVQQKYILPIVIAIYNSGNSDQLSLDKVLDQCKTVRYSTAEKASVLKVLGQSANTQSEYLKKVGSFGGAPKPLDKPDSTHVHSFKRT
jgi:hypothetical protein